MGLVKKYGLIAIFYLFAGFAILYTHYWQTSPYSKTALDETLTLVAASHFSLPQLVDNLPTVFRENPHAAAFKIINLKGEFLGAMYDARRMRAEIYKQFLDTAEFSTQKSPFPGYEILIWESKGRKLRIVALSLERTQWSTYLVAMSHAYALQYVIPLYILAGVFLLFVYHRFGRDILQLHGKNNLGHKKRLPFFAAQPKVESTPQTKISEVKNRWQLKSGMLAEGSIYSTLAELRTLSGAESVRLFAKTTARWQGIAEVRGSLAVRGEAMEIPNSLSKEINFIEEIVEGDKEGEWLCFNGPAQNAQLCFVLYLAQTKGILDANAKVRIADFVKSHSRNLIVEHYYENSILDVESGLYSFPYANFTLKERILSGLPFAVAAFEFPKVAFDTGVLQKLSRTAIRTMREYFTVEEAPVISRGSGNTLLIIFQPQGETKVSQTEKAVKQLYLSYRNLLSVERSVKGALVSDAASFGSSTRTIKILSRLLEESAATGALSLYKSQSYSGII